MKQVILITDGCSNVGMSPVVAAAHAMAEGIVVNVIGVVDHAELSTKDAKEIHEIAEAGGGLSRIVNARRLAQTMQMMTRKTVAHTIQQLVKKELRQIIGRSDLEALHPDKRAEVVQTIDEWSETVDLEIVLLVDASASMKPKFQAVVDAIEDLMISLQARTGNSKLAVFHFPASHSGEDAQLDLPWTIELAKLHNLFNKLEMKGTTPTGPALLEVIRFMKGKDGMISDNVG